MKTKFKLLDKDRQGNKIGPHRVGNQKYRAGDVLESNLPLDRLFRGKFERVLDPNVSLSKPEIVILPRVRTNQAEAVVDAIGVGVENAHPTTPFAGNDDNPDTPSETIKSHHGVDVTDDFPNAELAGMKVYHDIQKDVFKVVDPGSDEVLKRAKTEKLVETFLKSQLG